MLTPIVRDVAVRLGAVDKPGERKIHRLPVPNLGGVSVFLSVCLTIFIAHELQLISGGVIFGVGEPTEILWGIVIVFLIGVYDDLNPVPPWVKFLFQCIAAGIVIWSGIRIDVISIFGSGSINPGIFAVPLTFLWIVGLTNAFNLIDGLDGLAAGLGIIAATTSAIIFFIAGAAPSEGALLLILAGALAGFLRYNFHPASIFLGDSGSQVIGYMLATLSVAGSQKAAIALPVIIPLLVFGLPILDTLLSMLRRAGKELRSRPEDRISLTRWIHSMKRMSVADRDHVHHRLLAMGLTHRAAVLMLYGLASGLSLLAFIAVIADYRNAGAILLTVIIGAYVGIRKLGYEEIALVKTSALLQWDERMILTRLSSLALMDGALITTAYWGAFALKYDGAWASGITSWFVVAFPVVLIIQIGVLRGLGHYRGIRRAMGIADLLPLGLAVAVAVVLSYVVSAISSTPSGVASFFGIDGILLEILVIGGHSAYMVLAHLRRRGTVSKDVHVLIYGAGRRGESIVRELQENRGLDLCPIGFLDDDPNLAGLKLNGVPVLGS